MPVIQVLSLLFVLALALVAGVRPARALTPICTGSVGNLPFGTVDVLAGARSDAVATLSINCLGGPLGGGHVVRVCASLGPGQTASFPPRTLIRSASSLRFEIYPDVSGSTPWGSWSGGYGASAGVTIDIPLVLGLGSAQRTVYGSIFPAQFSAPPGTYLNNISDAATSYIYVLDATAPCSMLSGVPLVYSFLASATVQANCNIATNDLSFGVIGALAQAVDAQTALIVTCSTGLPYSIALDGGRSQATDPASRKMTGAGGAILYGLYSNAARTQAWGASGAIAGSGTASAQTLPIYGRMRAAQKPLPGTYSAVIVVTVTY